jgi:chromosome segregation ATPase
MSDTTTTLKQRLSQQLGAARDKLDAIQRELTSIHEEDMATLKERQEEIRGRLDQQQAQAQKLQADISTWKNEKVAHTQEAITSWKQQREMRKLEARAERARDYAIDMVTVAAYDFDQAEQAVFDALAARIEADSVATSLGR